MRKISFFIMTALLFLSMAVQTVWAAERLQDTGEKLVIVIDPGHGGSQDGTIENGHVEKNMTMTTALAMYDELMKYDNVEVYLTHTKDVKMILKDRAKFAESVDADFLFSIHYNASESHELYGSEVWTSLNSPYNGYGYQFGYELLTDLRKQGLLIRGVKTRLGEKGDYYGIIRECVALDIPAVIIEHCHVDEAHDEGYCDTDEELEAFGRADATAVARYFGLKSSSLNVDYSDYQLAEASADSNVKATLQDTTEPDFCELQIMGTDYENNILSFMVYGADSDSALLYYSYSVDGGLTFSAREAWPGNDTLTGSYAENFTFELPFQAGTEPEVVVRAYNPYDLYTESNHYIYVKQETTPAAQTTGNDAAGSGAGSTGSSGTDSGSGNPESFAAGGKAGAANDGAAQGDIMPVNAGVLEQGAESGKGFSAVDLLMIVLAFMCVLMILLAVSQGIAYHKDKNRRRG